MKVSLNRNFSSIARASTRISNYNSDERKARTRTLIQAGGLLSLSGLLQKCGILEGEDLQLDFHAKAKAEILMGILLETAHQILDEEDDAQMEKFKTLGRTFLKRSNVITTNQQKR